MYSQTPLFHDVARPVAAPTRRRKPRPSALAEAIAPYLDIEKLQAVLVGDGSIEGVDAAALQHALRTNDAPPEILAMLDVVSAVLYNRMQRVQIRAPSDAASLLMLQMGHLDQEELRVLLLDTKNRVLGIETVYRGSVNAAMIRIGEVFKPALRVNAPALIVCHNHPSGDPTPSTEDIMVTRQIVEAGKLLDCEALDHLVIGTGRFVSMREKGLGFSA
jgi:DNA repair protein RadC